KSAPRSPDATDPDPIDLAQVRAGGNGGSAGSPKPTSLSGAKPPAISHHPVAFARTIAPSDRGVALALPSGSQTIQELPAGASGPLRGPSGPPPRESPASSVVGTPYYMSPEIWRGEPATRRSDVYSLGALIYELSAGHPPNDDLTIDRLAGAIQSRDVPPL